MIKVSREQLEKLIEREQSSANYELNFRTDHRNFMDNLLDDSVQLKYSDRKQYLANVKANKETWLKLNLRYAEPFFNQLEEDERKAAIKTFSKEVRPGANYIAGLYESIIRG